MEKYLANFANLIRIKSLVEAYNDNFEKNEMKELEKEVNKIINEQEEDIIDLLKESLIKG